MDVALIPNLAVDKRLIIKKPGATSTLDFESILIVEGFSKQYNFIYARIEHGEVIGTLLPRKICGCSAVCIYGSELKGYEIELRDRYKR